MKNIYSIKKVFMAEIIKKISLKNMGGIVHTTDT